MEGAEKRFNVLAMLLEVLSANNDIARTSKHFSASSMSVTWA
jgi:hypothetical protein